MDDKNLNIENNNVYRAMPNMNTAIENPDVNMTGVMDVNIKDVDTSFNGDDFNSQINIGNSIINHEMQMSNVYNNQEIVDQSSVRVDSTVQGNSVNNNQLNLEQNTYTANVNQNVGFLDSTNQQSGSNLGVQEIVNVSNKENDSSVKEIYKPTFKSKTKPKKGLAIPKELFVLIIIVVILLLFLFVMPYIYEFFRNLNFAVIM